MCEAPPKLENTRTVVSKTAEIQVKRGSAMRRTVEVSVDERGDILVPAAVQEKLGLVPGMVLRVVADEHGNLRLRAQRNHEILVEKDGVLVASVEAEGDLDRVVRDVRGTDLQTVFDISDGCYEQNG